MWHWCKVTMVTAACWALVIPVQALDWTSAAGSLPTAQDVALSAQRTLTGICIGPSGRPVSGFRIALTSQGRLIAETETGPDGRFVFEDVRGGAYTVVGPNGATLVRAWAAGTEPPHAQVHVVLHSSDVVRGQRPFADIITNPLVIATVITAAIAIPIAVHNSGKDRSGS